MRRLSALLVLVLALVLAGCGEDEAAPPPADVTTAPNGDVYTGADVTFATHTIQHHAQTLALLDLALGRPLDDDLAALLDDVRDDRTDRVQQLTTWLTVWGEPVPSTVRDHASAHGAGDGDVGADLPGMPTPEQVRALADASDGDFAADLTVLLADHLAGAGEIADVEVDEGHFDEAVTTATELRRRVDEDLAALGG